MVAATLSQSQPLKQKWFLGPMYDFWLVHGACGILFLPYVYLAFFLPASWDIVGWVYLTAFLQPHHAATWVRMYDPECRKYQTFLTFAALPLMAALTFWLVYQMQMLGIMMFILFSVSIFHHNRQNFGIMRHYVRLAGESPEARVSRLAEVLTQVTPWTCAVWCLYWTQPKMFIANAFTVPIPYQNLFPIGVALLAASITASLFYAVAEFQEWRRGRLVGGRLYTVVSSFLVYALGLILVKDISWSYVLSSSWHSTQYLAYIHAFRTHPPANARLLKITPWIHLAAVMVMSLLVLAMKIGIVSFFGFFYLLFSMSIGLHHFLADSLVWRRRALLNAKI